jgi:S1-C subfamily serine protease
MARLLLLALISLGSTFPAHADAAQADSMKIVRLSPGDGFPIPETGALVVKDGTDLTVRFVPPAGSRPEKYKSVDLQEGDLILLVNGKRVKTVEDLKKVHAETPVGGTLKLGIQRDQEMMIVSFEKGDPKDLPRMNMRIVTSDDDGTRVLPAVGVMLVEKKKSVVVEKILPVETSAVKGLDVKEGDVIVAMNGTGVASLKAFVDLYDGLAVGDKVEWKTRRSGKEIAVSFPKPKPIGRVIMRRDPQ